MDFAKIIIMWMKLALKAATKPIIYNIMSHRHPIHLKTENNQSVQFSFLFILFHSFTSIFHFDLLGFMFLVNLKKKKPLWTTEMTTTNMLFKFTLYVLYIAQCNVCDYCGQEHDTISASLFFLFSIKCFKFANCSWPYSHALMRALLICEPN